MTPKRIQDRKALHAQLDLAQRRIESAGIDQWHRTQQSAYGLLVERTQRLEQRDRAVQATFSLRPIMVVSMPRTPSVTGFVSMEDAT